MNGYEIVGLLSNLQMNVLRSMGIPMHGKPVAKYSIS
jgi:hypothetical protein